MDDGDRAGEKEIAERWAALEGVGEPLVLPVERGALQLTIDAGAAREG